MNKWEDEGYTSGDNLPDGILVTEERLGTPDTELEDNIKSALSSNPALRDKILALIPAKNSVVTEDTANPMENHCYICGNRIPDGLDTCAQAMYACDGPKTRESNTPDTEWVGEYFRLAKQWRDRKMNHSFVEQATVVFIRGLLTSHEEKVVDRVREACAVAVWNEWAKHADRLEDTETSRAYNKAVNAVRSLTLPITDENA